MRIAVIADVHGNLEALKAVLNDIDSLGMDGIYCAGDLVGYGPFPNEVIRSIRSRGIPTVQGNYDQGVGDDLMACGCDYKDEKALEIGAKSLFWSQENVSDPNKAYLRNLPGQISEKMGNWQVLLVHGSPRANNEYLFEDYHGVSEILKSMDSDILICGHTHVPFHKQIEGKHLVNAGSVGKPKHGTPEATYVSMDIEDNRIRVDIHYVAYDVESTAQALEASGLPVEFAAMLRNGKG